MQIKNDAIRFGDWVQFTQRLSRVQVQDSTSPDGWRKVWKSREKPGEGIYLGTRTLQNGDLIWAGDEEGYRLNPTERIRVAYVSPGTRSNPIYVPLDSIGLLI